MPICCCRYTPQPPPPLMLVMYPIWHRKILGHNNKNNDQNEI